ncbi:lyase family protein [Fictibacillus nanhaiensis]|uniref:lyase family protein n=1 Tax=Fictibacillus nanhaiensis TaxID=742169 RepID=UPI001FEB9B61|nr:lyase family protein [Fictibacillus nanhaiensis]
MRVEEDVFGSVELPADALYGIQTVRTIQNLSFSNRPLHQYPSYIKALAGVKKAAALANCEAGLLPSDSVNAITAACEDILEGDHHEQFLIDVLHGGGGIGANMNVNEVIANLANEKLGIKRGSYHPVHPIDSVNLSQSTSDVCHTGIRIAIIHDFQDLHRGITLLIEELEKKVKCFIDVTTISRTCLQDGMRARLSDFFSGYVSMLKRRLSSLEERVDQLHFINLGATVIGSGLGASPEYRAVVLDKLCEVIEMPLGLRQNLYDAAQNIDDLAAVSSELRLLSTCLIKMAKDLRLLSSGPEAGFGEIQLSAIQASSSFFPGKINPVVPETVIQCCFQVLASDRAVQATLEHGELNLNVFEGAAGINILEALSMLKSTITTFHKNCIAGLDANRERCEELSNTFIPVIIDLKEQYGYAAVSSLLKEQGREGVKNLISNGGEKND